jgi:hypothetical protein
MIARRFLHTFLALSGVVLFAAESTAQSTSIPKSSAAGAGGTMSIPNEEEAPQGVVPLSSAFTYQGQLKQSGLLVNGVVDMRFRLYDGSGGGAVLLAGPINHVAVAVTNGLFTVDLGCGGGLLLGVERWLEVAISSPSSGGAGRLSIR